MRDVERLDFATDWHRVLYHVGFFQMLYDSTSNAWQYIVRMKEPIWLILKLIRCFDHDLDCSV